MIVKKPVTGCLVERGGYYHTLLNVYVNGKRKQISRTTGLPVKNNYRKALKVLEDRKKEYDIAGLPGMLSLEERQRAGSMLLSEHMHRWSEKRKSEISPLTYQSYMGMIDGRIKSFFDSLGVTLSTVTPQLIDDFLESVGDAGCNSSTQQRYYQVLNTCLKHAVKKDLLDRNPIEKVDRPKKAKFHAFYFSDEEALRLLECAKTDYCYIPILLSTYYGLRRSEAIGLQWSSVDFDNNQIHIDHKAYCGKVKGKSTVIITTDMKTETSRRTLPLISFVREELLRHKAQQESYRKAFGKGYSREWTDCVCVDAVGKIISPEKLTSHFPDFLEANNLRKIRFHDLRHTCASLMVAQGINIKHIQLWLGHSNYSTTADTYSHLNPHAMDVPADCIDEAVRRVLTARIKLGQLDDEKKIPWAKLSLSVIGCKKHSELAYEAAVKSMVLLKNNGILPLKKNANLLVVGNNAAVCQYGDYSGKPKNKPVSPLEGIRSRSEGRVEAVRWDFLKTAEGYNTVPAFCYCLDDKMPGVHTSVYANAERTGEPLTRTDEAVDFAWLDRFPDPFVTTTEFSCFFKGNIKIPVSGDYSFRAASTGNAACEPPELTIDMQSYDGETMPLKKGDILPFTLEYKKRLDNPSVRLEWTAPLSADESELFVEECEKAENADAVIAVLGLGTEYESEGKDKTYLDLPAEQLLLLRKLAAVNKNIILVTENGSALTLVEPASLCSAILEAWYPGERGGDALADILFGNISPSGRLPLSFPRSVEDLPPFDDYEMSHGRTYMYNKNAPLYPFGFGLSYTKFIYSDITVSENGASVTVKNAGDYDGDEVVQLYIDSAGLPDQPKYRLKGFRRVHLKHGQSKRVGFTLSHEDFSLFNACGERKVFPGEYGIYIGGSLPENEATRYSVNIVKQP